MTSIQEAVPSARRRRRWPKRVLIAIAVIMAFRSFAFQPFSMPSVAMMPNVLVGDYFLLEKYAYGYTHYSLPFSPELFSGRIFGSAPERGDVVMFHLPKDDGHSYIERVVGLPGDRIHMKQGVLHINGTPVARERLADFDGDVCGTSVNTGIKRWRETLPNGVSYETLDCVDNGFYDNTDIYWVPPGHFFVLGDNRDNSSDSRALSAMGYIPLENFIGRVGMIFYSVLREADGPSVRSGRMGKLIR